MTSEVRSKPRLASSDYPGLAPWAKKMSPRGLGRALGLRVAFGVLFLGAVSSAADFVNVAKRAGLTQVFPNGGDRSKEWILETTGSGAAWVDYDNDGLLDAFVVSGEGAPSRLYRGQGEGKFVDVTSRALPRLEGWGQGVCTGDVDNDGFTDLFVTYWGPNRLLRNLDGERFEDVTESAGLAQSRTRYNTGCAFLDIDNDGDLDLFVANYLRFDFETTPRPGDNPYCYYRNVPAACGPRGLPFDRNLLYLNDGDGGFRDVSEESGVAAPSRHYALGVVTGDFNSDGWTDLYVACDRTPSILYINQRDGTFEDEALFRGAALDEDGRALSGMGVAAADYDGDGAADIFRTNFSDERSTLYRNRGEGDFDEATVAAGMGANTRYVGWGVGFLDYDNDGFKDVLLVNGHVFPEVDRAPGDLRYRERAILYHNLGDGRFEDVSEESGPGVLELHAARGAAFADADNDGRVDVLVNNQNEPPSLLMLDDAVEGDWILLRLEGTRSNRSAIGAKVRLTAGGRMQAGEVRGGGSYLSQNDLRLRFGLGDAEVADVEITWPSGRMQRVAGLAAGRAHRIREPR